jgi:hypothetical protein
MNGLRVWIILAWIALPTVMYGGYSLLQLINRGDALTPAQVGWFRAGHAHAGVLLLMSLRSGRPDLRRRTDAAVHVALS